MLLHPLPPPFFHFLQVLLLLRCEILRNLTVRLSDYIADVTASVASDLFELGAGFVDDRRNFGHLFVGQMKLPA